MRAGGVASRATAYVVVEERPSQSSALTVTVTASGVAEGKAADFRGIVGPAEELGDDDFIFAPEAFHEMIRRQRAADFQREPLPARLVVRGRINDHAVPVEQRAPICAGHLFEPLERGQPVLLHERALARGDLRGVEVDGRGLAVELDLVQSVHDFGQRAGHVGEALQFDAVDFFHDEMRQLLVADGEVAGQHAVEEDDFLRAVLEKLVLLAVEIDELLGRFFHPVVAKLFQELPLILFLLLSDLAEQVLIQVHLKYLSITIKTALLLRQEKWFINQIL